tara:strand:- start:660 stop:1412 length:753 start_codon:yes stop_codon:yes gene_type:complete
MRVASQADILNLHAVEEGHEDDGEMMSSEIISDHWHTMFDRNRVIEAVADRDLFQEIERAVGQGLWRPKDMPAYDMNNTNANNCFFYSDAPGTPSYEFGKMLITEENRVGFQEVMVNHSQSNTTLHQIMKKTFDFKQLGWRDRVHAITMWSASHHPMLWAWEHNQRYWMENRVCDPEMDWNAYVLSKPDQKDLTLGSLWPMANWQMHCVGELGAKSYVAREKLNAASFSAFLVSFKNFPFLKKTDFRKKY